jgi:Tol biopolymer transport system component
MTTQAMAAEPRAAGTDVNYDGPGKNPKVANIKIILQEGARPHFSPDGKTIVFDRKNEDGYYALYTADLSGHVLSDLTKGNPDVPQKNSGNGVFHPSGRYVVFISEVSSHFDDRQKYYGDAGVGLFCNLWAIDIATKHAWQLTDIPIKRSLLDKTPAIATVNPRFTPDGETLLWTERYAEGTKHDWGKWRIKAARFSVEGGRPRLKDQTVVFTPMRGNYVTLMGFPGAKKLLLAGNLDGQHEYGMDEYAYDIATRRLTDLTPSPETWEEDSHVFPQGKIVYMSNKDSHYRFNFNDPNWAAQPMERDYYLMSLDGSAQERLTYFNEPGAPEHLGKRVLAVASDVNRDGSLMAATLGVDFGTEHKRNIVLKVAIMTIALAPTAK